MDKNHPNKAAMAVALCLILVALLMTALFLLQQPDEGGDRIVLPDPQADAVVEQAPVEQAKHEFVQVTPENVVTMLQSLQRPSYYHQVYTVTVGSDDNQSVRTVELWVSQSLLHAEITHNGRVKSVLTNGQSACIWYDGQLDHIAVTLTDSMTMEDLIGLPGFDYLQSLSRSTIVDAGYLVLENPLTQCIYVCVQDDAGQTSRHWFNLENGLVYKSDILENSLQVYEVRQERFELLAAADESFTDRFCLPDGAMPFTAQEETPQP